MNLLTDKIKTVYFKYLYAAFGSAMIVSIYSVVDMAIVRPKAAFIVSVLRGLILSGALILILPKLFGGSSIWWAMPITEVVVAILAIIFMIRYTRKLA